MSRSEPARRTIPAEPGSYLLLLYLRRGTQLQIGRLGSHPLRRGWYLYAGSAFGPGGLKARLGHHCRPPQRLHWHIDYLRQIAELRGIYWQCGINNEHRWPVQLLSLDRAEQPLPGFGSSDCRCFSHLVYLPCRPPRRLLRSRLAQGRPVTALSWSAAESRAAAHPIGTVWRPRP